MNKLNEYALSQIEDIVINCEEIQREHGSEYSKEQAKISAYNEIKEVLGVRE